MVAILSYKDELLVDLHVTEFSLEDLKSMYPTVELEVSTGVSMKYWLSRQMAHDLQQAETLQVDAEPLLD